MKENINIRADVHSYIVAITGASGSLFGFSLLKALIDRSFFVHLIISKPGFKVIRDELGMFTDIGMETGAGSAVGKAVKDEIINKFGLYKAGDSFALLGEDFLEARIASGSAKNVKGMIAIPCSMGSLSRIANGISGNLIERAADVMLKEKKKLIVCPRETPFSDIYLKNMLSLHSSGAIILPPIPAFYNKPQTVGDIVDFITGKILDALDIENDVYARWNGYDSK
jgi:4-hydroxy-3-polyprenylbenzoate decarboxylase